MANLSLRGLNASSGIEPGVARSRAINGFALRRTSDSDGDSLTTISISPMNRERVDCTSLMEFGRLDKESWARGDPCRGDSALASLDDLIDRSLTYAFFQA